MGWVVESSLSEEWAWRLPVLAPCEEERNGMQPKEKHAGRPSSGLQGGIIDWDGGSKGLVH